MTLKYYQNLSQSGSVCQILCYKLVSVSPTGVTLGAFRSLFRRLDDESRNWVCPRAAFLFGHH